MENKIENILDEFMIKDVQNLIIEYVDNYMYAKVLKQFNWHITMTLDIMIDIGQLGCKSLCYCRQSSVNVNSLCLRIPSNAISHIYTIPWKSREFQKGLKSPLSLLD